MLLLELALIILISYTEVEASFTRGSIPVSRIERPTKSTSRGSRSRIVLTTTSSPRTPEASHTGGSVFESKDCSSVDESCRPSSPSSRRVSSTSPPSRLHEMVTPVGRITVRAIPAAPRRGVRSGNERGQDGTPNREDVRRLGRTSTVRVLSFESPPRTLTAPLAALQEADTLGSLLDSGGVSRSEVDELEETEAPVRVIKRRRVSSSPESNTRNP